MFTHALSCSPFCESMSRHPALFIHFPKLGAGGRGCSPVSPRLTPPRGAGDGPSL